MQWTSSLGIGSRSTWTLAETRKLIYDDGTKRESAEMAALAPSEGLRQRVPACGRWRNNLIEELVIDDTTNTIVDGCATARRWQSPELAKGSRNWVPACGRLRLQTKHYIWGNDLSGTRQGAGGVGGLLASTSTSSTVADAFYHYDANGNVIALSDSAGNESASYEYSAFGSVINATGPAASDNPFRFSTKYQDTASGVLYYGYRSYDPETGRWLNRDPIRESGGLNVYAFVGNGPVGYWDYLGLFLCCNKCEKEDEIDEASIEVKLYSIVPINVDPSINDQADALFGSVELVGTVQNVGGVAKGAAKGLSGLAGGASAAAENFELNRNLNPAEHTSKGPQDVVDSTTGRLLNLGFTVTLDLDFKRCTMESCLWKQRLEWTEDTYRHSCSVDGPFRTPQGYPTQGRITSEIEKCSRDAISKLK